MSIHLVSTQDTFLRRTFCLLLIAALLFVTAHRLPAPISEIPESPTPSPEQSAKPKPKRTIEPKAASENSKSQAKTASPPQSKATPQHNLFDGTWRGRGDIARSGVIEQIVISGGGTSADVKLAGQDLLTGHDMWYRDMKPKYEGGALILDNGDGRWALTPNTDGKTAHFTCDWPGFLLAKKVHSSATFRRTSP